jgi:hypothetical protein
MRTVALAAALAVAAPALTASRAGEIPDAIVVLEAAPGTPGSDPTGAPLRFVLMKDGQAFVGGTARVEAVRLTKDEASALRKRAEAVRRAIGREAGLALGDGGPTVRLRLFEDAPRELRLARDAAALAPPASEVQAFVADLLAFRHAGLAPHAPDRFALRAREASLPGGCRAWTFPFPIEEALAAPRVVPRDEVARWPKGGWPASVCAGEKRYVVTLRPLLPDEQP